jgi:hypothetical protein
VVQVVDFARGFFAYPKTGFRVPHPLTQKCKISICNILFCTSLPAYKNFQFSNLQHNLLQNNLLAQNQKRGYFRAMKKLPSEFFEVTVTLSEIKATEHDLHKIYDAAYNGLTKDALAVKAGFTPQAFATLLEHDPNVGRAILEARAENHYLHAKTINDNAAAGDTKAAIFGLTHFHGYMPAKPDNDVTEVRVLVENAN